MTEFKKWSKDAAVEAERDAATLEFLMGPAEQSEQDAGLFLLGMRDHRRDWLKSYQQDWNHVVQVVR